MDKLKHYERRAVLVQIVEHGIKEVREEAFEEFRNLVETLGFEIAAETTQVVREVNYSFFVGKGKLEEIRQIVKLIKAEYVFVNATLSYLQLRNLSREFGVPCVDRPHLILMIFSMRAKTSEGKLQVELSQLKMRLPEIVHNEVDLDQQTGSEMGLKGPGERRTELKRRYIENRVKVLERRLEEIKKHREERRKRRKKSNFPIISIAGYTNSGKSTLINALTGARSYVENMLFATLDTLVREAEIGNGMKVLFVDTIGFIRELPTALIYAFHSTLEEICDSWAILHVIDSTAYDIENKINVVVETLAELGCEKIPQVLVFNKIDLLSDEELSRLRDLYRDAVFISAKTGRGLPELLERVYELISRFLIRISLFVPYDKGKVLSLIYESTNVISRSEEEKGVKLLIEGNIENVNRFREYFSEGI